MYTHSFKFKFYNDGKMEGELDLNSSPVIIKTHLTTEDIITCTETTKFINSIISNVQALCRKKEIEKIEIYKL